MLMQTRTLDPLEAPAGHFAVLKASVATAKLGNICRACDWRPECQKSTTDFTNPSHRCMATPVVSRLDGKVIARKDGCAVVFKRLPIKN